MSFRSGINIYLHLKGSVADQESRLKSIIITEITYGLTCDFFPGYLILTGIIIYSFILCKVVSIL